MPQETTQLYVGWTNSEVHDRLVAAFIILDDVRRQAFKDDMDTTHVHLCDAQTQISLAISAIVADVLRKNHDD